MPVPRELILYVVCAATLPCLGGCHAPPIIVSSDVVQGPLASPAPVYELWRDADPEVACAPGGRIAILECSLELVTMKQVTPSSRQAMVGGPISPLAALVEVSGIFRKRVRYPPEVCLELPSHVYEQVVRVLETRGLTVIDARDVADTWAYDVLGPETVEHSSPIRHLDPRGSDAGRTNEFRVYPAQPLRVLDEGPADVLARAERAIRRELDADLTLRIRLRVGIYHGRASIERGSVVTISGLNGTRRTVSKRSILSRRLVGACDDFQPVAGRRYEVDWRLFREVVTAMSPGYLAAVLPEVEIVNVRSVVR